MYSKVQYANVDDSPTLAPEQRTELQAIIGTLLYYARAVDPTLLPIANELASQQASPTVRTLKAVNCALSYAAGNPNKCTIFYYCDMILHGHVDASYLSRSHARFVAGAYLFLGDDNLPLKINGAIHTFSTIIPCIVASAGEAEYVICRPLCWSKHAASLRTILADLGHPQLPTILMCDDTCAMGIATDSIKQKRSKSIDMRFHWVRDRVRQGQFLISHIRTDLNVADYFTKNLDPIRHNALNPYIVQNSLPTPTQT